MEAPDIRRRLPCESCDIWEHTGTTKLPQTLRASLAYVSADDQLRISQVSLTGMMSRQCGVLLLDTCKKASVHNTRSA